MLELCQTQAKYYLTEKIHEKNRWIGHLEASTNEDLNLCVSGITGIELQK